MKAYVIITCPGHQMHIRQPYTHVLQETEYCKSRRVYVVIFASFCLVIEITHRGASWKVLVVLLQENNTQFNRLFH